MRGRKYRQRAADTEITPYFISIIHEFFHFIRYMIASIAFFLGIGRFRTDPYGGKLITILNVDTYNTEEIY